MEGLSEAALSLLDEGLDTSSLGRAFAGSLLLEDELDTEVTGFEGSFDFSPPRSRSPKDDVLAPAKAPNPLVPLKAANPPPFGSDTGVEFAPNGDLALLPGVDGDPDGGLDPPSTEGLPNTGVVDPALGGELVEVEGDANADTGFFPTSFFGLKKGESLLTLAPKAPNPSAGFKKPLVDVCN